MIFARKTWFTVGFAISLSAVTFAKPISPNADGSPGNPANLGFDVKYRLGDVYQGKLSRAEVTKTPWTGPWWPSASGSAAIRISQDNSMAGLNAPAFSNHHYSADELVESATSRGASPLVSGVEVFEGGLLDTLSPMEKLDVTQGHAKAGSASFYLNTTEALNFARLQLEMHPRTAEWNGLCNGFAAAASMLPEPRAVKRYSEVYKLSDGRKIQFLTKLYSGDLKGLASYVYAQKTWEMNPEETLCDFAIDSNGDRSCNSLGAGNFHALVTNIVGRSRESFVVDTDPTEAVWNYPIVGYRVTQVALRPYTDEAGKRTRYARSSASEMATHEARIVLEVDYMGESNFGKYPWKDRNRDRLFTNIYEYLVELTPGVDGSMGTEDDVVVGGQWLSKDHPHFAWKVRKAFRFTSDFKLVDPKHSDTAWSAAWQESEWAKVFGKSSE